ncbi:hypothetical protein LL912_00835 [Niabella sp. CC-SYL272]|uniref:hypothetical protein n=1 Tax=Niabella agricola TaxID=2891571 RepID=UPI001F362948|nr:hypothetical protein [Niabella agricola]MCF3107312.1 hypothetical protein [Niabella agricola]
MDKEEYTTDEYDLQETPITYEQYLDKIDYRSYFKLMGVPDDVSNNFHRLAQEMAVTPAIDAIKPHFSDIQGTNCLVKIRRHFVNAVERLSVNNEVQHDLA